VAAYTMAVYFSSIVMDVFSDEKMALENSVSFLMLILAVITPTHHDSVFTISGYRITLYVF